MAAPIILLEALPRKAADGSTVPVRLAGGGGAAPYFYDGQHWRAGITGLPRSTASLDFDGQQLGGGGVAQAMGVRWAPSTNAALAELAGLFWTDAPVKVRIGPEGAALPPVETAGLVLEARADGGVLDIALADVATDLKRPVLVDRFAGTGGVEGPVEWEGRIRSRAWGRCFNVPGEMIDKAHNVLCFGDPRHPWDAFVAIRTGGAAARPADLTVLPWQGSVGETFAALRGAAVIAGGGVLCPSIACVKWWTAPTALHADIRGETEGGYVETAPEIAARIVAARSTLPFAAGEVAAAAATRSAPFGWRIASDTATAAQQVSEILGDVSLSWLIVDGAIVLRPWDWSAPVRSARSHAVQRQQVHKPVATRKLGYRRNHSPMARGDLAAIVLAQDVVYDDGQTGEALKPATPGATAGAPAGTPIGGVIQPDGSISGGKPAEDVVHAIVDSSGAIIRAEALKQEIEALTDTYGDTASAEAARIAAEAARDASQLASTNSQAARDAAQAQAEAAAQSKSDASGFATTASGHATTATQRADEAGQFAQTAEAHVSTATTKAGEAKTYRDEAATSASNASGSATTATQQAGLAAGSSGTASGHAQAASNSATTATTKATEAGNSAVAANQSKLDAQAANSTAQSAASAASGSASTASEAAASAINSRDLAAAYYNGIEGSPLAARLGVVETVTTNGTFAAASTVSQLRSEYNGTAATVSEQAGTLATVSGRTGAYWSVEAAAGGRARLRAFADGFGSSVDIAADQVFLGNQRTLAVENGRVTVTGDLYAGNGRIVFNNGSVMKVQGVGFGSHNQFIEWFGPVQNSFSDCTEANATFYLKTNGAAYFGGALSAGVLRNSVQTTDISPFASVKLGPFGSNGGPRTYVLSYNYSYYYSTHTGGTHDGTTPRATIELRRNSASGPLLTTLNATGSAEAYPAFPSAGEPGHVAIDINGSTTFVDNAGGTTITLYAVLVTRIEGGVGGNGSLPPNEAQVISIVSTE